MSKNFETCEVGAGNPAASQSKRREGAILVGRRDGEYWFIDSVFWHDNGLFGCTGMTVWPVSTEQADEALEPDSMAERYDDYWQEYASGNIKPGCRDCTHGPNEDGCAYCGYQSLNELCAEIARYDGYDAVFDVAGGEYEDALREQAGLDDQMELADCSGCGRIFGRESDLDSFDEIFNKRALVACLAYEDGAVSYDYAIKVIYGG